jgi:hypothetical protein
MRLAIKREAGEIPLSGYYYALHPFVIRCDEEAVAFTSIGYTIIEIDERRGERLLDEARNALALQAELLMLDEVERKHTMIPGVREIEQHVS